MAAYSPTTPELGKNALSRRVSALREMNLAGGAQFKRYAREGHQPTYQIKTVGGEQRDLTTREVPAYVLAQADLYEGVSQVIHEALDAAFADPTVQDREALVAAVLRNMDEKCGDPIRRAAAYFAQAPEPDEEAVAAVS